LILGALAFIGAAVLIVYLAAGRPVPQRTDAPTSALPPQAYPLATPPGEIITRGLGQGARAPDFSAPRFDGGTLRLTDLRGKAVVMNFFASWCPPCRAEARDLETTFRKYRDRGIVFLGVNIEQDTWDDARAFLKEFGISYPAVRDERADIARKYQLYGLPTTYFIDKDGIIQSKFIGPFLGPEGLEVLEDRIEAIAP
jgi:peroxiredoxin